MGIVNLYCQIRYLIRGINIPLYYSKKDGVWFKRKGKRRVFRFQRYQIFNLEEKYLIELLKSLCSIFRGGEIIGKNEDGKQIIQIRTRRVVQDKECKAAKRELMKLFKAKEIFEIAPT